LPTMKLTKRAIDAIEPVAKPTYFFDSDLPGFFLRIMPSGARAWGLEYRAGTGRNAPKRRITIASFGKLTPDQARTAARSLAADVMKGADPATCKGEKAREMSVSDLISSYEKEGCGKLKPLTKNYTLARLRHHVVPLIGTKRISEVRVTDVERMIFDITAGKTARDEKIGPRKRLIVKGGSGAARKVMSDLLAVFSFAVKRELLKGNPVKLADKPPEGKRESYLKLEGVEKLGSALEEVEAEGGNPMAINMIRLLLLTGCRRNEIAGLRWSEVDLDHACLRLGDTKTGRSVRPLGTAALVLLSTLPRVAGTDYVFPATSGTSHFQGLKKVWAKVRQKAELQPDIVLHTLRHTVGSAAVSGGESLAMTGAILGHANYRSTALYAHIQNDPARQAADRVIGRIAAALNAGQKG
jgi:integrase